MSRLSGLSNAQVYRFSAQMTVPSAESLALPPIGAKGHSGWVLAFSLRAGKANVLPARRAYNFAQPAKLLGRLQRPVESPAVAAP